MTQDEIDAEIDRRVAEALAKRGKGGRPPREVPAVRVTVRLEPDEAGLIDMARGATPRAKWIAEAAGNAAEAAVEALDHA